MGFDKEGICNLSPKKQQKRATKRRPLLKFVFFSVLCNLSNFIVFDKLPSHSTKWHLTGQVFYFARLLTPIRQAVCTMLRRTYSNKL